jgi:hypothetical protein
MLKTSISIILFFISIQLYSQCDYVLNETDEFTGDKQLKTQAVIDKNIIGPTALMFFSKVNDTFFLTNRITFDYSQSIVIPKKEKLMLKLMNDSIITLHATNNFKGEIRSNYGASVTSIEADYYINKLQINLISKYPPVKYRMYVYQNEYIEKKIKKKFLKNIGRAAECILK